MRLERRNRSESIRLDFALRLLASPLEPNEVAPPGEGADGNPWLLACLALGKVLGIQFLPHPDWRKGIAIGDPVDAIARASRVRVRSVALKGRWWKQDVGPLLACREDDHAPVALLPTSPGCYEIYDPATRSTIAVDEEVASSLEPFGWHFYRPFPLQKLSAWALFQFGLKGCRVELSTIIFMGIATCMLALAPPVIIGIVFDSIIPGASRPQLFQLFLLLIVVAVCASLFRMVQSFSVLRIQGKMDASIQAAVWDRLLSLPVPFFRGYSSGDLAMRALGIAGMQQILTGPVLSSVLSGVFSIFSFLLLFYYSWELALLATGLTLLAFGIAVLIGCLEVRYQRKLMKIQGHLAGLLLQIINGISKLRISGTENRAFAAWAREFAQQKTMSVRARKATIALTVFTSAAPVLFSLAIFGGLAWITNQKTANMLSTGDFLAFNAAFIQFQFTALAQAGAFISLLGIVPLYERAKPILEALPEVSPAKSYPGELLGHIEVKHVNFRYRPDGPLVLRDLSLRASAGQFVAIVGPSGSGKSTLFRMLLGFETPESGSDLF